MDAHLACDGGSHDSGGQLALPEAVFALVHVLRGTVGAISVFDSLGTGDTLLVAVVQENVVLQCAAYAAHAAVGL